jgi:hypothetical protein
MKSIVNSGMFGNQENVVKFEPQLDLNEQIVNSKCNELSHDQKQKV